jgi:hypothetical protein
MVHPQAWNKLVDYVTQLEDAMRTFAPKSSPDILARPSPGGTTFALTRRGGGSRGGKPLPFTVSKSIVSEVVNLSVLGGAYQIGDAGAWVTIPPTAATAGSYAYLVIEQDAARAVASDGVSISIEATALDPVVVSGGTTTSNVLIAEMITVDGVDELAQRRHGNFTIGIAQIDGDAVRWPVTLAGTIPTPEPPP